MTSKQNVAMAKGHLMAAANEAESLTVMLTVVRDLVRTTEDPAALIGDPMARAIEDLAARVVAEALADAAEEPEIENGRITEVAGPREERLADVAAVLFASRGDSFEIREGRQPGDPDAAAYAEGAALPNPGAKLAGPSFDEWLSASATA